MPDDAPRTLPAVLYAPPFQMTQISVVTFTYRNWEGESGPRRVIPARVWFGRTRWYSTPQWLLTGFDLDKQRDRDFAMKDMTEVRCAYE